MPEKWRFTGWWELMKNREINRSLPVAAIVVPCFNEEAVLDDTAAELIKLLDAMIARGRAAPESRIVFVDDGSGDATWERVLIHAKESRLVAGISLRRNVGHQNALFAGLMEVREFCDAAISLDADLQDDPGLIPAMLEAFCAGKDVVYAVRRSRMGDGWAKKASAFLFYRLMERMGADLPRDCGDFRLLSRKALEELGCFREPDPFLRGLIPLLGLPSETLFFDRRPRKAGKSKYSLPKMVRFAANGIITLTDWPIVLIFRLGAGLFGVSLAVFFWLLSAGWAGNGWKIAAVSICGAAGLILMAAGTIGLYIFRIWQRAFGHPHYQIREKYFFPENPEEKYKV